MSEDLVVVRVYRDYDEVRIVARALEAEGIRAVVADRRRPGRSEPAKGERAALGRVAYELLVDAGDRNQAEAVIAALGEPASPRPSPDDGTERRPAERAGRPWNDPERRTQALGVIYGMAAMLVVGILVTYLLGR